MKSVPLDVNDAVRRELMDSLPGFVMTGEQHRKLHARISEQIADAGGGSGRNFADLRDIEMEEGVLLSAVQQAYAEEGLESLWLATEQLLMDRIESFTQ